MTAAALLEKLANVRKTGNGWTARCPAHDDKRPSLSIGTGDDGRLLVKCHAGCSPDEVMGALGLAVADLMPVDGPTPKPKVVATYRYEDELGVHLFDVVRYAPKGFRQRRADGVWTMQGVRRVLYRLPHLAGHDCVFITEGEKDADALATLGVAATCNPGGAGKWRQEYAAMLVAAGCKLVTVLPDRDEPGQAHALDVAACCHAAGLQVRVLALEGVPAKGDVSDWLAAGGSKDALLNLAGACPAWTPSRPAAKRDSPSDERLVRRSQAAELIDLAHTAGVELWHTPAGDAYGTIGVGGHSEHHPLRRIVRDHLARLYFMETRRAASSQALTDAMATLAGMARYEGAEYSVSVRLARANDKLYLDLGDAVWTTVEVDAEGWRVCRNPQVRHWRPASLRALPRPTSGGHLDALRDVWPRIDDDTWTLLVAWLVSAVHPSGPYPILVETGEQGSGKSTLGRMVRGIIDPASPELRGVPRDERDVMIGALTSYVVALDNLSGMAPWLSDALCRVATGGGLATRTLYSDVDETLIDVCRPILLTGIDSPASRGDLLDRALVVTLPTLSDERRLDETNIWQRYQVMRPALLGALLDAASCALRRRGDVQLARRPRMADACTWVTAAEPALRWPAGLTAAAWLGAREATSADLLAADPVAQAVIAMSMPWSGTMTELLALLSSRVPDRTRMARTWPTSPRGLSGLLRRLAPDLRRAGVELTEPRPTGHTRDRVFGIVRTVRRDDPTPNRGLDSADGCEDGRHAPGGGPSAIVREAAPRTLDSGLFSGTGDSADGADGSSREVSRVRF